jgi:hypothetical protein
MPLWHRLVITIETTLFTSFVATLLWRERSAPDRGAQGVLLHLPYCNGLVWPQTGSLLILPSRRSGLRDRHWSGESDQVRRLRKSWRSSVIR